MNEDGKVDLIRHRATDGSNQVWLMDNPAVSAGIALFSVADPTWVPASFADLNGDRRTDLLYAQSEQRRERRYFSTGSARR